MAASFVTLFYMMMMMMMMMMMQVVTKLCLSFYSAICCSKHLFLVKEALIFLETEYFHLRFGQRSMPVEKYCRFLGTNCCTLTDL